MKHVIINFPGTNKRMAEGYTEKDIRVGLWLFYNSSGDIIYRIQYNENGRLDGSVIAGHDNFYQNYEYDNNEMKTNTGYRNGRLNYSFKLGSNQEVLEKTNKELPAIGEYFLMSLNANQKPTDASLTFNLYLPVMIRTVVLGDVTVFKEDYATDYWGKFNIGIKVKLVDVENIWKNSTSNDEFNSKFLAFLNIKDKIINNDLISDENTDNIISVIKSNIPGHKSNDIRVTIGNIRLGNTEGFGWTNTANIGTFKSCPIIIDSITINDASIDPDIEKLKTFPGINSPDVMTSATAISSYRSYDDQRKYGAQYTTGNTNPTDVIINVFNLSTINEDGKKFSVKFIDYYWYEIYGIVVSNGVRTEFRDRTLPFHMLVRWRGYRVNNNGQDERHVNGVNVGGLTYSTLKWLLPVQINKDDTYKLAVRIRSRLFSTPWQEFDFNIRNVIINNNENFLKRYPFDSVIYNKFLDWRKYKNIDIKDTTKVKEIDSTNPSYYQGVLAAPRWDENRNVWQPEPTRSEYPYIDLPKLIITDNYKRIYDRFINNSWKAYKWPSPEYETINPAEIYPDTSWEIISTDLYLEYLSKETPNNRGTDDRLNPPVITDFNINGSISGTCIAKKVICYCKDDDDRYYEKYVCTVKNGTWSIENALCILPYNVRSITNLTFIAIPLYKEGYGKKVEHKFTLPAGWRRDWNIKIPAGNVLNDSNVKVQDKDDIPLFIWRRTGDFENYHPYKFKDEFKEYCITAPEDLSLYRSGRYSFFVSHDNVIKSGLDGDDIIYYHGNELIKRNWNSGLLNPTMILNDINGNRLSVSTLKNDALFSGSITLNIDNHDYTLNFINTSEDKKMKDLKLVVGNNYNGNKIYLDIENKKV